MIRQLLVAVFVCGSAIVTSQAPEFAQQYRQRLGGALDELSTIVNRFDQDAAQLDISRLEALLRLAESDDEFVQARADSMRTVILRYQSLSEQQHNFNTLNPIMRPAALLGNFDAALMEGTWDSFEAAIPLSQHGLAWTGLGGLIGWLFLFLIVKPVSFFLFKRRRRKPVR